MIGNYYDPFITPNELIAGHRFIEFSEAVKVREEAEARLGFHKNHGAQKLRTNP